MIGLLGITGCASAKPKEPPLTMAQWIDKANAERRLCSGSGWIGAGSNGFDSYSVECVDGMQVYTDTTKETQKAIAKEEAHKAELAHALTTRILSTDEMKEVAQYGSNLLMREMIPYNAEDVERRFQTMLMIQQTLRAGTRHAPMETH